MPGLLNRTNVPAAWQRRLERARVALAGVLDQLAPGEDDWAPDDGIASIRQHVVTLVENEVQLVRELTGCATPLSAADRRGLGVDDALTVLDGLHRRLLNWLGTIDEAELTASGAGRVPARSTEDLLQDNLERKACHRAAIALLAQLIDPTRLDARQA